VELAKLENINHFGLEYESVLFKEINLS